MSNWQILVDSLDGLPSAEEPGWDQLSEDQRRFVAMAIIEAQVANGGVHAIYFNNCDHYLRLAVEGYQQIGANGHVQVLEKMMALMSADPWSGPPERWPDPNARDRPMEAGDIEQFDALWAQLDDLVLDELKVRYIESNASAFTHNNGR